jgi:hypothetical protein
LSVANGMCAGGFQAGAELPFQVPCLFFDPHGLPLVGVITGLLGATSGGSHCTGLSGTSLKTTSKWFTVGATGPGVTW